MRTDRLQSVLYPLLYPFSVIYAGIMRLRRKILERDTSDRFAPPCPCISVGNIAWGGTGKTPITDWLLTWAESHYRLAVVLSRGYKSKPDHLPLTITPRLTSAQTGDEPLMLALDHPACTVIVDPDRSRAGRYALKTHTPALFVLDDAFQHLAVIRDLDLVLLRPKDVLGSWNSVLPAGTWREGASALSRADAFLITCDAATFSELIPQLKLRLCAFDKPVFSFSLRPKGLFGVRPFGAKRRNTADIVSPFPKGQPYVLVSGVGDPAQVVDTATAFLGYPPTQRHVYSDHHRYTLQDAVTLENYGLPLVCTQKDAVKLRELHLSRLWSLRVEAVFGPCLWSETRFPEWLDRWWSEHSGIRRP